MDRAIILFTRVPIAGKTKTRLESHFSKEQCALIHTAILQGIYKELVATNIDLYIFIDPIQEAETMQTILGENEFFSQYGSNLNNKMYNAFWRIFLRGYKKVLLLGSDIIDINKDYVLNAFNCLKQYDIAIGPAKDGGYGLVAMNDLYFEVFDEQSSSHKDVLNNILDRINNKNISFTLLDTIRDIDTIQDIDDIIGSRDINTILFRIKEHYEQTNK